MMAKKRKLTDEGSSQLLDKSDECRETESSTLDSKNIFLEIKRKYGFRISHLSGRTLSHNYFAKRIQTTPIC